MSLADLSARISRLESVVKSIVRVGVVSTVNRDKCRVCVTFPSSRGGFQSGELPVMVAASEAMRDYSMPAVDEQVVCVFLPNGPEAGFVLGSFYSDQDAIPDGAEAEGERVIEADTRLRLLVGGMEASITNDLVRIGGDSADQPFVRGTDHKALLEGLIDLIVAHVHPTGVGPSGPPANSAAFTAKKPDVAATLSEIIKGR